MNVLLGDPEVRRGENIGPLYIIGIAGFDMLALRYDASIPVRFAYVLRDDGVTWDRVSIN